VANGTPNAPPSPGGTPPPGARAFIGVGIELALALVLCMYAGSRLDAWANTAKPWFTLAGAVLGLAIGFYGFVRRVLWFRAGSGDGRSE
jgi:hypothetical protein